MQSKQSILKENLMENILYSIGPYQLNKQDIIAFQINSSLKKEILRTRIILSFIVAFAISLINFSSYYSFLDNIIHFLTWFLGYFIFITLLVPFLTFFYPSTKKILTNEAVVQILDDKFYTSLDGSSSSIAWKNIDCIRQSKNHIFIYVTKNCANIIPKNLFETQEKQNEFLDLVNRQISLHKMEISK